MNPRPYAPLEKIWINPLLGELGKKCFRLKDWLFPINVLPLERMMKMENGTEDERVLQQFSLPRFEIELAQNHSTEVLQGIGCAAGMIARIDTDLGHPEG